jgi:hypothetical protein
MYAVNRPIVEKISARLSDCMPDPLPQKLAAVGAESAGGDKLNL